MTDITKCTGANCDLKLTCYRYTSPASDYQSTFLQPPIVDGKCEMYWGETAQSIFEQLNDVVGAMNCDECGGFGYHKMSCSRVK
jgi:hypothetical protein